VIESGSLPADVVVALRALGREGRIPVIGLGRPVIICLVATVAVLGRALVDLSLVALDAGCRYMGSLQGPGMSEVGTSPAVAVVALSALGREIGVLVIGRGRSVVFRLMTGDAFLGNSLEGTTLMTRCARKG
jgi:hypothetical protein